ncbi:MAG: diadenylate cyclase CdaA [Fimbriimonadales bacterium]
MAGVSNSTGKLPLYAVPDLFSIPEDTGSLTIQLIDVLIVAYLAYRVLTLVRGSRAWRIIGGVTIYLVVWYLSDVFGLRTLHFILDRALILGPVALVILLLPEMRSALEGIGKLGFWPERLGGGEAETSMKTIDEIVSAVAELSQTRAGAILVVERSRRLPEIENNGVAIMARVSAPLLVQLFHGTGPTHDGAVLIRGNSVTAAACFLPLSASTLSPHMHLRHRASAGVTEDTDALSIVVSEQRGTISVAENGRIREGFTPDMLRTFMAERLIAVKRSKRSAANGKAETVQPEEQQDEVAVQ